MDRLTAIQVFIEVAKSRSFTKSADRLNMSRPMVTRYITALEEWVGVSLFQRTTRNVSLTPGGEIYLEKCKQIQNIAFDIEVNSKATDSTPRGAIRVAAGLTFALSQFKFLFADFLAKYPDISLNLVVADKSVDLVEEQVDFAIRISNNLDPHIISKQLGLCTSCLVASPDYLKKKGQIRKVEDLKKHSLVTHDHFRNTRLILKNGDRTEEFSFNSQFSSNETLLIQEAVLEGMGVAMLPLALVKTSIEQKKLIQILPDWELQKIGLHIVFTNRKFIAPQVRLFIDYLTEKARLQTW